MFSLVVFICFDYLVGCVYFFFPHRCCRRLVCIGGYLVHAAGLYMYRGRLPPGPGASQIMLVSEPRVES